MYYHQDFLSSQPILSSGMVTSDVQLMPETLSFLADSGTPASRDSGVAVGEPFLGVQTGDEVEEEYCPRQRLISGIRFRMRPQNTMKRPDTTNGIT
ncbi:hypothetical protein E2C01_030816 [Portunus trituberculatus]|uniref:Uncharacterized protein n=1 Tax=Portunus trituberculatus TaxID=210409 RepID=A0A5B7EWU9_PORTR|nr:hypothetical protein [Portunus trituberculatus]